MPHDSSKWLQENVEDIEPVARAFLEEYSEIPPPDVLPLVLAVRARAWALYPWPCIGQLRFLRFNLASYPLYPSVIFRLRADKNAQLLDIGCCFGQDIRKAFVDGVEPTQLVGLDLVPEFRTLGYELFKDSHKLSFEYHVRDILDDAADWSPLESRFDVIHMTSVLHIWDWAAQVKVANRVVSFSKVGAVIVGSGLGSGKSGEFPNLEGDATQYRQSEESFERFWKEVGADTGTRWDVKSTFKRLDVTIMNSGQAWAEPNMGILAFEVTRLG